MATRFEFAKISRRFEKFLEKKIHEWKGKYIDTIIEGVNAYSNFMTVCETNQDEFVCRAIEKLKEFTDLPQNEIDLAWEKIHTQTARIEKVHTDINAAMTNFLIGAKNFNLKSEDVKELDHQVFFLHNNLLYLIQENKHMFSENELFEHVFDLVNQELFFILCICPNWKLSGVTSFFHYANGLNKHVFRAKLSENKSKLILKNAEKVSTVEALPVSDAENKDHLSKKIKMI